MESAFDQLKIRHQTLVFLCLKPCVILTLSGMSFQNGKMHWVRNTKYSEVWNRKISFQTWNAISDSIFSCITNPIRAKHCRENTNVAHLKCLFKLSRRKCDCNLMTGKKSTCRDAKTLEPSREQTATAECTSRQDHRGVDTDSNYRNAWPFRFHVGRCFVGRTQQMEMSK